MPRPSLPDPASADDPALRTWARELGVTPDVMTRMLEARRLLVDEVATDPRAWGFDLLAARVARRDVAAEYRARARLQGTLGESFLAEHGRLLALVPDPPTFPDGRALDVVLRERAGLDVDAARDISAHLRSTIQVRLGRALDQEAIEHAVREASWDHEFDPARTMPNVLRALVELL